MARKKRDRRGYATDLTDGQWGLIAPLIPEAEPGGRPRNAPTRTLVVVEIVKRDPAAAGFEVLRCRWVVERTFTWIVKNRRLTRDYEQLTTVAETLITIAATATRMRRWP